MSGGIAGGRLAAERKNWRANRPFGFVAKPMTLADGSTGAASTSASASRGGRHTRPATLARCGAGALFNVVRTELALVLTLTCAAPVPLARAPLVWSTDLMHWECAVPGKESTDWHGGLYALRLTFSSDYPTKPPECRCGHAARAPVACHP